jgi:CRP-like cAMP-binding protein
MGEGRFEGIPLFASLSRKERKRIAQCVDEVDLPEGKHLVEEGDFAYEVFVIEAGTAEVLHGDERLAELGPGDIFGEMGAMEHATRNASVVSTSPLTAVVMTARDFRQIAREMPHVAERIRGAIEERSRALSG